MPNEKNSASSAIWSATTRLCGDLDHRADQEINAVASLLEHLFGHGEGPLLEDHQLLDGADQGDHDFRQHSLALPLDGDGRLENGANLHVADLGELDRQAAAAQAKHGVGLLRSCSTLRSTFSTGMPSWRATSF